MSSGLSAWTAHLAVLKLVLWLLGVPSAVPFLEAVCYTGYPLVSVCINTVVVSCLGGCLGFASCPLLAHAVLPSLLGPYVFLAGCCAEVSSIGLPAKALHMLSDSKESLCFLLCSSLIWKPGVLIHICLESHADCPWGLYRSTTRDTTLHAMTCR